MIYESTVTSKGTITLPASIRKKLGIVEGRKVRIQLRASSISIKPQDGWDEFFAATETFGEKARAMIASGEKKSLLTNDAITRAVADARKHHAKSRH